MAASLLAVLTAQPKAQPGRPAVDVSALAGIDTLVQEAIQARLLPGAVVLVGHGDEVVYEQAFGQRAVEPSAEPMTLDTIFDLA